MDSLYQKAAHNINYESKLTRYYHHKVRENEIIKAPCGKNAAHHSILSSPVPKIFSVKLHRILFKFVLLE